MTNNTMIFTSGLGTIENSHNMELRTFSEIGISSTNLNKNAKISARIVRNIDRESYGSLFSFWLRKEIRMRRPKTYLQIEESRNRRLWFKEVVIPSAVILTYIFSREDVRAAVKTKKGELDEYITQKLERIFSKRAK